MEIKDTDCISLMQDTCGMMQIVLQCARKNECIYGAIHESDSL